MKKKNALKRQVSSPKVSKAKKVEKAQEAPSITQEHLLALYKVLEVHQQLITDLKTDNEAFRHNLTLLNSLVIK